MALEIALRFISTLARAISQVWLIRSLRNIFNYNPLSWSIPSISYFAGLSRLERLYEIVNSEEWKIEIDVVRIINVEHCYALLRQLDSRMTNGDKNIVVDLSTERSLELVLRQVCIQSSSFQHW